VEFRAASQGGNGTVLDISHDGIAFTGELPVGERFTAVAPIPVKGDAGPVDLVLHCEVVRKDPGRTAARILARRFAPAVGRERRTMAAGSTR
jgi:hypothetical protein